MMIVDANIATYWMVNSPFRSAAAYATRTDLIAPAIIRIETVSALLKYQRAGFITRDRVNESIDVLEEAIGEFVDDASLIRGAAGLAAQHSHPVYHCLYLALALQRQEPLATTDRRMATLAQTLGITAELILPDQQEPAP